MRLMTSLLQQSVKKLLCRKRVFAVNVGGPQVNYAYFQVLRRGDYLGARIDLALPERQPLPRPDLRQYKIGVGPVAVFGASNFPLAFLLRVAIPLQHLLLDVQLL